MRWIGHLGGIILREFNRGIPFCYPRKQPDGSYVAVDRSDELMENAQRLGIEAVITIGGDGPLENAPPLCPKGLRGIGGPKTIGNDVSGTGTPFGFGPAGETRHTGIDKSH